MKRGLFIGADVSKATIVRSGQVVQECYILPISYMYYIYGRARRYGRSLKQTRSGQDVHKPNKIKLYCFNTNSKCIFRTIILHLVFYLSVYQWKWTRWDSHVRPLFRTRRARKHMSIKVNCNFYAVKDWKLLCNCTQTSRTWHASLFVPPLLSMAHIMFSVTG